MNTMSNAIEINRRNLVYNAYDPLYRTMNIKKNTWTGFKGFGPDMKCMGKQYQVGMAYKEEGNLRHSMCQSGYMHFCMEPFMCLHYYPPVRLKIQTDINGEDMPMVARNKICIVETKDEVIVDRNGGIAKCATMSLSIIKELSIDEIIEAQEKFTDTFFGRYMADRNFHRVIIDENKSDTTFNLSELATGGTRSRVSFSHDRISAHIVCKASNAIITNVFDFDEPGKEPYVELIDSIIAITGDHNAFSLFAVNESQFIITGNNNTLDLNRINSGACIIKITGNNNKVIMHEVNGCAIDDEGDNNHVYWDKETREVYVFNKDGNMITKKLELLQHL